MRKDGNAADLGLYLSLLILNNKMFERGIITESMRNRLLTQIQLEYQKI